MLILQRCGLSLQPALSVCVICFKLLLALLEISLQLLPSRSNLGFRTSHTLFGFCEKIRFHISFSLDVLGFSHPLSFSCLALDFSKPVDQIAFHAIKPSSFSLSLLFHFCSSVCILIFALASKPIVFLPFGV